MPTCGRSAWIGVVMVAMSAPAWAGDKLTEQNMTQKDYDALMATESSVEGEPPTEPPGPVHNLTQQDEQDLSLVGGVKLISGKDWKKETPVERDAHLRRMDATVPEGSVYIISIPKGDVWLVPAADPEKHDIHYNYDFLFWSNVIRPWTESEREALPKTVARDKKVSQSDKRGTINERIVQQPQEDL